MKLFSKNFSKDKYMWSSSSSKNVFSLFIFITPLLIYFLYPLTANAGLFSFISDIVGDKASAQIKKVEDVPNSQTMTLLKASYSINNSEIAFLDEPILSSENVLLPEIGPSGTVSELKEPINTQISIYVVREGDTLSEIARLFDVSVNTIIWANNLGKNKIIKRGQTLVILPISGINHKIEKGETIKSIVAKYKANLEEVLQYNNISINSTINKGDVIAKIGVTGKTTGAHVHFEIRGAKNPF